jgi:hypothetical protein
MNKIVQIGPKAEIIGISEGPNRTLVVTCINDGVLIYSLDCDTENFPEDQRAKCVKTWRQENKEKRKFNHKTVYSQESGTFYAAMIDRKQKKQIVITFKDDRGSTDSVEEAARGGEHFLEDSRAVLYVRATTARTCLCVDDRGRVRVIDEEGTVCGILELYDDDDDDDRASDDDLRKEIEAVSGNAETEDIVVAVAFYDDSSGVVVKREVVRYCVKEMMMMGNDNTDDGDDTVMNGEQQQQRGIAAAASRRLSMFERVQRKKPVRILLTDEVDKSSSSPSSMVDEKKNKVIKVSFDDEHFCCLWSNGAWTSHDFLDGKIVRERLFDGLQIFCETAATTTTKKQTQQRKSTRKTTTTNTTTTSSNNKESEDDYDTSAIDFISIGGGYYAVAAKIKIDGSSSKNNNVAIAIIDKLYGVIHSFVEVPDSETTETVSLSAFGGNVYVSLSDRIYSLSLELEELSLRVCMAALQRDIVGKAANEKAKAAERAFSSTGFDAATKAQCRALTIPVWKQIPEDKAFEGACNDIDVVWDQEEMRKQEKVAEDFIVMLESGNEKNMIKALEIFANKHVKEAIKWIDESERKTKEALKQKREGHKAKNSATVAAAGADVTNNNNNNNESGGSDNDDRTDEYESDDSEEKEDEIKNAVYYGWNDPTSNNIRSGAFITPHCVDAAIKAAWTTKKWDYLSEAFSRGLLLGGALSSIGLIEKLLEDDRLIDAVNMCVFTWWLNPDDARIIVDACMNAKNKTKTTTTTTNKNNNNYNYNVDFQALYEKNKNCALEKVKLCEKQLTKHNQRRSGSKKQQFYEELELRAALDDCRIWSFVVENFKPWAQPLHTITARTMFHREDTLKTLKGLSNEDALDFLQFIVDWVEFHVVSLKGEFNTNASSSNEPDSEENNNNNNEKGDDHNNNNTQSEDFDLPAELNFDFAKKYKGVFPSLKQSIEWSSALLDCCLPAFSGNANAQAQMEKLSKLCQRQFDTNANIQKLAGALEHVRLGHDIPEGLGVTSQSYSIEKVNW